MLNVSFSNLNPFHDSLNLDFAIIKSKSEHNWIFETISSDKTPTCSDKFLRIAITSRFSSKANSLHELHKLIVEKGSIKSVIPVFEAS